MTDHLKTIMIEITARIVSAFVSNNSVAPSSLPELLMAVHLSLHELKFPTSGEEAAVAPIPAISIKKSITNHYLICLEDGKRFKSLKRHLKTSFGMSPEEYRTKWRLPLDYPMVAPVYSAQRSELAKSIGLGMKAKRRRQVKKAA